MSTGEVIAAIGVIGAVVFGAWWKFQKPKLKVIRGAETPIVVVESSPEVKVHVENANAIKAETAPPDNRTSEQIADDLNKKYGGKPPIIGLIVGLMIFGHSAVLTAQDSRWLLCKGQSAPKLQSDTEGHFALEARLVDAAGHIYEGVFMTTDIARAETSTFALGQCQKEVVELRLAIEECLKPKTIVCPTCEACVCEEESCLMAGILSCAGCGGAAVGICALAK